MRVKILIIIFFCYGINLFGQENLSICDSIHQRDSILYANKIFYQVEKTPYPKIGWKKFHKILKISRKKEGINIPIKEIPMKIYLSSVIDESGKPICIKVLKGQGRVIDDKCIEIARSIVFKPAFRFHKTKKVPNPVKFSFPFVFEIVE